jgi:hypothetical protein
MTDQCPGHFGFLDRSNGAEGLSKLDKELLVSLGIWPKAQTDSVHGSPYIAELGASLRAA